MHGAGDATVPHGWRAPLRSAPPRTPSSSGREWDLGAARRRRRRRWRARGACETRSRSHARSPRATAGRLAELDRRGLARAMRELAEILELAARAGAYAALRLLDRHRRPRARRAAREGPGARDGDPDDAPFFELRVGGAAGGARGGAARGREPRLLPPPPAQRPPLPRAPADASPRSAMLAEKSLTGPRRWSRLFEEQTSALQVAAAGEGGAARRRAQPPRLARPRDPPQRPPRRSRAALAPGPAHARVHHEHAARWTRRWTIACAAIRNWLAARNLANEVSDESVSGTDRSGARPLRARRGAGIGSRRACSGSSACATTTAWLRSARTTSSSPSARLATWFWTATQSFAAELGEIAPALFERAPRRCARAPGKRGGAFCAAAVPERRSLRPAQLHLPPPRRADGRPRARPRGPLLARRAPGDLPPAHAAHARRDGLGVRRDDRLRPPARPGHHAGVAPRAARGKPRGHDRDGLPAGRDEPLRGPGAHCAPRARGSSRSSASASSGRRARRSCWATRSRSRTATARGGPTSRTSSTPRATSTPTPTASCSRSRSTSATSSAGEEFVPQYLELLARRRLAHARGARRIVDVDIADPGFWDAGLDLIERQLGEAEAAAEATARQRWRRAGASESPRPVPTFCTRSNSGPRDDPEEERRCAREDGDEHDLGLRAAPLSEAPRPPGRAPGRRRRSAVARPLRSRAAGRPRASRPARERSARARALRASRSRRPRAGSSRARSSSRSRSPRPATCSRPRRRVDQEELADEARRSRGSRRARASRSSAATRAAVAARPRPATASMQSPRSVSRSRAIDDRERRHVHQQVDGEVEDGGAHAELRRDDDAGEHVARLARPAE